MTFAEKIPSDEGIDSVSELNRTFAEQSFPSAAPMALMPNVTFAAKFCFQQGIPFGDFANAVFQSCLYPHARQLVTFLGLIPSFFDLDLEFVAQAGRLSTIKQLEDLILDYTDDRRNRGPLRGSLNLRISARKMRQIASPYLQDNDGDTELAKRQAPVKRPSASSHGSEPVYAPLPAVHPRGREDHELAPVGPPRPMGTKTSKKKMETQMEIALLQEEVARLIDQRDVLKRALGITCEPSDQTKGRSPGA